MAEPPQTQCSHIFDWIVTALSVLAWQSERWYCLEKPWLNDTAKQNPVVSKTPVLLSVQGRNQTPRRLTWSPLLQSKYDDVSVHIVNKTCPSMKVFPCKRGLRFSRTKMICWYVSLLQNQMAKMIANSHIMQTCGKRVWSPTELWRKKN